MTKGITMGRHHLGLVLAALACFGLAACNGSDKASPFTTPAASTPQSTVDATEAQEQSGEDDAPPAEIDPCTLVTKKEADKLAGVTLAEPDGGSGMCTFATPTSGPTAQVEVYVGDGAKKYMEIDRELGHEFTTVDGVGDEAYAEDGVIFFVKGGTWVGIHVFKLSEGDTATPLKTLARTAAGRM